MVTLKVDKQLAWIEWNQDQSKVNLLSTKSLNQFSKIIDQIIQSKKIKVALIISKKPTAFIAGIDLKETQTLQTKEEFLNRIQLIQRVFKKIRESSVSFIACIHGTCLGAGAELALACDYRIASDDSSTQIGFPEVHFNFIPGLGGCIYLPQLIQPLTAINLIATGKIISSREAHSIGLVDQIFPLFELKKQAKILSYHIIQQKKIIHPIAKKNKLTNWMMNFFLIRYILSIIHCKWVIKKTTRFYTAPAKAIQLIYKTYLWPIEKALKEEQKVFCDLAVDSVSKNLIHLFFLTEKAKKNNHSLFASKQNQSTGLIKKIGILGAGTMGRDIAYHLSCQACHVRLQDINTDALVTSKNHINHLFKKQIKRKKLNSQEAFFQQSHIHYTTNLNGFLNTDLVIESISENESIKKNAIKNLSNQVNPSCIVASNTSSLSISNMAESFCDPFRFVGLHFFNPVYRMPLVEVIQGEKTSLHTLKTVFAWMQKINKYPVIVKDSPGFLVNRLLMAWLSEALWMAYEGTSIRNIDNAFSNHFGFSMGPFRLMDQIGWKVCLNVIQNFRSLGLSVSIPKHCEQILRQSSDSQLKIKSNFYHYTDHQKARAVNSHIQNLITSNTQTIHLKTDAIIQRGMYRMINEGAKALSEKIISSPEWLDFSMIMGVGFPAFRGGLMKYADQIGLQKIVKNLNQWMSKEQTRFQPCHLLKTKANQKKSFYS